jgi:hypothetical protein
MSKPTKQEFVDQVSERANAIAAHLIDRLGVPEDKVELPALFLGQFEHVVYGFFPPLTIEDGKPRPAGLLASNGRLVYETDAGTATTNRRGVIARLNGHGGYQKFVGDDARFGCYSSYIVGPDGKKAGAGAAPAPVRYQAMTIECDVNLDGSPFHDVAEVQRMIVEQAIPSFRRVLAEAGLGELALMSLYSGGKSIHIHLGSYGTTDKAEHEKLVGIVKRLAVVVFAAHGLAIDMAALRPSQAVRVPGVHLFGRNQAIIEVYGWLTPERDTAYYLEAYAASPFGRMDAAAEELNMEAEDLTAFRKQAPEFWEAAVHATHEVASAAERLKAIMPDADDAPDLKLTRRMRAVEVAAATVTSFVTTRGALEAVDVHTDDVLEQILEKVRPVLKVKQPAGVRVTQRHRRNIRNNKPVAKLQYDRTTGNVTFNEPPLPSTPITFNDIDMTVGEMVAAISLQYLDGATNLRWSCSRLGEHSTRQNAYVFFDKYRAHPVYVDPSSSMMAPLLLPISDTYPRMAVPHAQCVEFDKDAVYATGSLHFVAAKPGTGKSTAAIATLKAMMTANPKANAMVIAPNVTLTNVLAAYLSRDIPTARVIHYQDDTATTSGTVEGLTGSIVVTTLHSARKFEAASFDVVIVDELGTALAMFDKVAVDSGGVWRGEDDAAQCYRAVQRLLNAAETAVLIEATPNAPTGVFFKQVAKAWRSVVVHTSDVLVGEGKRFIPMRDHLAAAHAAIDLQSGERTLVQVMNRKASKNFHDIAVSHAKSADPYAAENVERQHFLVNSDTTGVAKLTRDFLKYVMRVQLRPASEASKGAAKGAVKPVGFAKVDIRAAVREATSRVPEGYSDWRTPAQKEYDKLRPAHSDTYARSVVATSSLSAGISFFNIFTKVYIITNQTIPATTTIQAMFRERASAKEIVFGYSTHTSSFSRSLTVNAADDLRTSASDFERMRAAVLLEASQTPYGYQRALHYAQEEGFTVMTPQQSLVGTFYRLRHMKEVKDAVSKALPGSNGVWSVTKATRPVTAYTVIIDAIMKATQRMWKRLREPDALKRFAARDGSSKTAVHDAYFDSVYQVLSPSVDVQPEEVLGADEDAAARALARLEPMNHYSASDYFDINDYILPNLIQAFRRLRGVSRDVALWSDEAHETNAMAFLLEEAGLPFQKIMQRLMTLATKGVPVWFGGEVSEPVVLACAPEATVDGLIETLLTLSKRRPGAAVAPEHQAIAQAVDKVKVKLDPHSALLTLLRTLTGTDGIKVTRNMGVVTVTANAQAAAFSALNYFAATTRIDGAYVFPHIPEAGTKAPVEEMPTFTPAMLKKIEAARAGGLKMDALLFIEEDGTLTFARCTSKCITRKQWAKKRSAENPTPAPNYLNAFSLGAMELAEATGEIPAIFRPAATVVDVATGALQTKVFATVSEAQAFYAHANHILGRAKWNRRSGVCKYSPKVMKPPLEEHALAA